ncbi:MAG: ABC transporter ATP-binding protein, partial [Planctomycetota bacterium]
MTEKKKKREEILGPEEEVMSRPLDRRLLLRLLGYAKPYRRILLLTLFAIVLVTAADVAVPFITRYGIDHYIITEAAPLDLANVAPEDRRPLEAQAGKGLLALDDGAAPGHLLSPEALLKLGKQDPALKKRLDSASALGEAPYYLWRGTPGDAPEAIRERPDLFRPFPGGYAVLMKDLNGLPRKDRAEVRGRDLSGILWLGAILLGSLVLHFLLDFAVVNGVQFAGQNAMNDLRKQLFAHLQKMSLRFFNENPVGKLVTRGTSDIRVLEDMLSGLLVNLLKDIFLIIWLVSVMLCLDWKLSLVSFVVIPLLAAATFNFRRLARAAFRVVRAKVAKINAFLAENVAGMAIVQVFNREEKNLDLFRGINQEHFRARLKELYVFAVFRPLVEVLSALAIGLVIWHGGGRTLMGLTSLGTLVAFIAYVQMFFRPIQDISEKYNMLQAAMASSERVFQILDEPVEIRNPSDPVVVEEPRGRIEFEKVWFAYKGEDWILRDLSFVLEPGHSLALVGPTGAGKSTLIHLLGRYDDVNKGRILFDGVDIRDLDKGWLRSQLGVVMQDVFLFTGDIRSNIRLRSRHITDEAVVQAAEQVMANRFINRMPERYLEGVKERGSTFSMGERQLLAFARAMAFNPLVLVLDEATANVDSETEALIQESLEQLMMGRTSIVIAHRLSTIRNADNILVLQEGKVVESGSHEELLATGG